MLQPKSKVLVSVVMISYNHEKFIKEAIDGVLMQECDFDVELIIADDKSPDNTGEIVKGLIKNHKKGHWIEYTKHEVNKGMQLNFIWALQKAKGKYIGLCEGDDYWTDPLKLQKQVAFLESNEEYILTHSDVNIFVDRTKKKYHSINRIKNRVIKSGDVFFAKLESNYRIFTCTALFRNNKNTTILFKEHKNYLQGDLILFLGLAKEGLFKYFDEPMASYRVNQGSVTQSQNLLQKVLFKQSSLNIRLTIAKKYNVKQSVIDVLKIKLNKIVLELAYLKNDVELMRNTVFLLNQKKVELNRWQNYKISIVLEKDLSSLMKKMIFKIIGVKSKMMRRLSNYKNRYI
jgi:glycosyltransferase involved in cell wall biosynthesis